MGLRRATLLAAAVVPSLATRAPPFVIQFVKSVRLAAGGGREDVPETFA